MDSQNIKTLLDPIVIDKWHDKISTSKEISGWIYRKTSESGQTETEILDLATCRCFFHFKVNDLQNYALHTYGANRIAIV